MRDKQVAGLHYYPVNGRFSDAMPVFHDGVYHIYFKPYREESLDFHGSWGAHFHKANFFRSYPLCMR